jgi:ankyrin repeat protein
MDGRTIRTTILKAIRSGLDVKAASILREKECHLSLKSIRRIYSDTIKYEAADVLSYVLYNCAYRHEFDPSDIDNNAIKIASVIGHSEVVKILLMDDRVDPSADNNCAIRLASRDGHLEVVKILLTDERVDPSVGNNYAIRSASQNGHLEVVKILLTDERVDSSANDNYAIRWASANGHTEVVKLLESAGCTP